MRKILFSSLVTAAMASTSTIAMAQATEEGEQQSVGLQEIVVTATKRSENLQDVPVAVSAISSADLKAKGVFETSDLNNSMPNLQVSSPYGETQPNFSVRGVGVGTEFNANAASPVGVYVDEVYQAFRASHGQQLYDLEQIEVVRGPQGTLYGRNTTGGAINFITRKPELQGTNGTLTAGYGNFNRINFAGAVEFTPVPDKLGIRIAGTFVDSDSFVKNRLAAGNNTSAAFGLSGLNRSTGNQPGGAKTYGIRGSIRFRPSDGVDLMLKGYAAKSKGGTETPLPTGQSKTSDNLNYLSNNFLLGPLFQALNPAGLLPANYSQSGRNLGLNEIEADTVGRALTRAEGVVFTAKIDLSDQIKLVSVSGYDSGRLAQLNTDCDATPLRACSIGYDSTFDAFNQDVRLDYSGDRFKAIVGVFYGKDNVSAKNRPDFFNFLRDINAAVGSVPGYFNPGGNFGALLPAGSLPTGITATQDFNQKRTSTAVYGEASYQITDTLKFTGGLRYTTDKNIFRDGLTTFFDDRGVARLITVSNYTAGLLGGAYLLADLTDMAGNVVLPASVGSPGAIPGGLERRGKSSRVSGRAIIDWKPIDDVLLYASYSRGYRAGTFNGLAYGSSNQVYFVKPEGVDAYEMGFKTRFADNRVQINGSFYYYNYQGQQGQVVDATATANLISLNGKMKGLELDAQFQVTDTLKLSAALGLLDTEYEKGACPANPALIPNFPAQLGSCVVSAGGPVSVAGNPFPYAAKSSVNLGFDWRAFETGDGAINLHGDASYTGQFYYDSFKDYSRGPLPSVTSGKYAEGEGKYWILNSRLSYDTDQFSIAAWVKNITNQTYYPFGIALENLFGNGYRVRALPRTFGVEATVKF